MILTASIFTLAFIVLRKAQNIPWLPKIGWVYCLFSPSFLFIGKVGYSEIPDSRRVGIQRSLESEYGKKIRLYTIFMMPMFFARKFEKAIHGSRLWYPVANMRGSGKSEWSWIFNVFSATGAFLLAWAFGIDKAPHIALIILLLPIPLDLCLFILLFALAQVSIIAGAIWMLI